MPSIVNSFGKVSITTLAIGIAIGISVSNILRYTSSSSHNPIDGYIPDSPHSHGENDLLKGPDSSINWKDEHSHSHASKFGLRLSFFVLRRDRLTTLAYTFLTQYTDLQNFFSN